MNLDTREVEPWSYILDWMNPTTMSCSLILGSRMDEL